MTNAPGASVFSRNGVVVQTTYESLVSGEVRYYVTVQAISDLENGEHIILVVRALGLLLGNTIEIYVSQTGGNKQLTINNAMAPLIPDTIPAILTKTAPTATYQTSVPGPFYLLYRYRAATGLPAKKRNILAALVGLEVTQTLVQTLVPTPTPTPSPVPDVTITYNFDSMFRLVRS